MDRCAVKFKSSGFTDLKTKFIDKISGPDRFEKNALYIHMDACEYPIKTVFKCSDVFHSHKSGREPGIRFLEQGLDASLLHDFSVSDDGPPVGQIQHFLKIVGHHDDGHIQVFVHLFQKGSGLVMKHRVQGGQGFIQQQHLGVQDQRPGQSHPLLFPAAQVIGIPVYDFFKA